MAETYKQLNEMMKSVGFVLRKCASNYKTVHIQVPEDLWESSAELELDRSQAFKTLELLCFPQQNVSGPYSTRSSHRDSRIVVSEMSQLFDPLGMLVPVVVYTKMFIQSL